jgi:hypothetical protein
VHEAPAEQCSMSYMIGMPLIGVNSYMM